MAITTSTPAMQAKGAFSAFRKMENSPIGVTMCPEKRSTGPTTGHLTQKATITSQTPVITRSQTDG